MVSTLKNFSAAFFSRKSNFLFFHFPLYFLLSFTEKMIFSFSHYYTLSSIDSVSFSFIFFSFLSCSSWFQFHLQIRFILPFLLYRSISFTEFRFTDRFISPIHHLSWFCCWLSSWSDFTYFCVSFNNCLVMFHSNFVLANFAQFLGFQSSKIDSIWWFSVMITCSQDRIEISAL
jgi:hypothetical protein